MSELAMKVLDGTQSWSTHAPPAPSASTTVTSAPSWAATSAASYPAGPPPMITIRATPAPPNCRPAYREESSHHSPVLTPAGPLWPVRERRRRVDPNPTRSAVFSTAPHRVYRHRRAPLRRVWLEPGPGPHAGLLSVLTDDRHRLAGRLAAHVRRRGSPRLGGRGHHD